MNQMDYFKLIRKFVAGNFLPANATTLRDDELFLEAALASPARVLKLVGFLERTYDIKIEPAEMVPENLGSVDRITAFVAQKTVLLGTKPETLQPRLVAA